jgi:hypothetical protein
VPSTLPHLQLLHVPALNRADSARLVEATLATRQKRLEPEQLRELIHKPHASILT